MSNSNGTSNLSFKDGEPESIVNLLKIKGKDHALVIWSTDKKYYVPYEFLKKYYPSLVIDFYCRRAKFKSYKPKRKLSELMDS